MSDAVTVEPDDPKENEIDPDSSADDLDDDDDIFDDASTDDLTEGQDEDDTGDVPNGGK